ncbi:thiamine biosynthesis lipoprotein [Paenibacillus anaericanus]|uniref:FAD:protein FMN transferase n=1 Tax=Paenibacillus anaericanus TaxID=170367 RepID=UPI002788863A|nr:FAD:protein FMN transferase [Paenibacillus anaericanus]MDQ0089307.1 thiamine biosynthesis lipoprotein [Paenibacillus anaericanus]
MKRNKSAILLVIISIVSTLIGGCGNSGNAKEPTANKEQPQAQQNNGPMKETFFIFDTVVNVSIYDDRATKENLKDIEDLLNKIDNKISRTNSESEIFKVNANSGIAPVQVSPDTFELVSIAIDYAKRTNGLLDPSIGRLVTLWNIGHEGAHVLPIEEIAPMQQLCDYRKIEMNEETHEIYLQDKGMEIDLGSYGKGYAADAVYDYLAEQGFSSAIIDLGGNVFAMGQKPTGEDWNIGIQDPTQERGIPIGSIRINDKTVVTAGIYERYFIEDGKMYPHIINPKTGYPVDNNISSVTIITDRSTDADTMDTALVLLGIEEGLKFVENIPNAEVLFITKDKKLYASSGFKEMLNKTNDSYTYAN